MLTDLAIVPWTINLILCPKLRHKVYAATTGTVIAAIIKVYGTSLEIILTFLPDDKLGQCPPPSRQTYPHL